MGSAASIASWFGVDDDYVRPQVRVQRSDWIVAGALFAFAAINRELFRPLMEMIGAPVWAEYLSLLSGVLPLVFRRRWPVPVAAFCFAHFFASSLLVPEVAYTLGYQAILFYAIYSAASWARDRRLALLVLGGIAVALFGWLAWDLALGSGLDHLNASYGGTAPHEPGLLPPITSAVLWNYLLNAIYIGGAVMLGRNAWWQARNQALLEAQAERIAQQSTQLRQQAVTDERLRIARELHDVVAHHVQAMGIQAGAARTLLGRDPAAGAQALRNVEESSRAAVSEMRGLLGALRGASGETETDSRTPEPTLAELPQLVAQLSDSLQVELDEHYDSPAGAAEIALPLQLSLYRIIQEALTNVQRHSTARSARVTIRTRSATATATGWVEAEILDAGRPLPGSSGSGLGQLGMRERISSHGGHAEIGPRLTGGYRVRVRLPLQFSGVGQ